MSPCERFFDSRNSFSRFPITMMASWQQIVPQNGKVGPRLKLSGYHSFKIEQSPQSHKKRTWRGDALGVLGNLHSNTTREIPVRGNSQGYGRGFRDAACWPDDGFERRRVSYVDKEGAILRRDTDSAGNHEERRFIINERYCGLQPEGPIHGNLFRGDAARPSGYPCRLDKAA